MDAVQSPLKLERDFGNTTIAITMKVETLVSTTVWNSEE
jgi:hypothetical protein